RWPIWRNASALRLGRMRKRGHVEGEDWRGGAEEGRGQGPTEKGARSEERPPSPLRYTPPRPLARPQRPGPLRRPRGQCQVLHNGGTPLGAVRSPSSLSRPPHLPHANTSRAKFLRSSPAQSSRAVRSFFVSAFAAASDYWWAPT